MTTGEIKKIMSDVVISIVSKHQVKRDEVTQEVLDHYFNRDREFNFDREDRPDIDNENEDYTNYGFNYDPYFGTMNK